jgi:hypothetical protein
MMMSRSPGDAMANLTSPARTSTVAAGAGAPEDDLPARLMSAIMARGPGREIEHSMEKGSSWH